ncbi:hypothetical protein [Demequina sp.]|uniref:hypothetical protein n=1 Tax=Demequina sp. TaxID=2050685 RepID=UPI003D107256
MEPARRTWWQAEPERLADEQSKMQELFPTLEWTAEGAGRWEGTVPLWAFERPAPTDLELLLGEIPFEIAVVYSHAFPASPPMVYPTNPAAAPELRSFTDYHVLGDGSLCLLRDATDWSTRGLTTDLVLKAIGWRLEYALFQVGKIRRFSKRGIVTNPKYDALIREAVEEARNGVTQ